tara:strand:- start:794 stop:1828 length:1035 start_codon:yes stop_codon:yes gene_type:complete
MGNLKMENNYIDSNLKPVKVGGESSALEISKDDVRVKNLFVSGDTTGVSVSDDTKLPLAGGTMTGDIACADDLALDVEGELVLDSNNGKIMLKDNDVEFGRFSSLNSQFVLYENAGASDDDYFRIRCLANGNTQISTVDGAGEDADLFIGADGDITLDSKTGKFIAQHDSTEFSVAGSSYAGMILGFTEVFDDNITMGEDSFQGTTTSFVNLSLTQGGGEKYLKVAFVVPPSNKVLIKVNLPYCSSIDGGLKLGLATDTSATTLHEDYERIVWDVDETDSVNINAQWVIHGSDHSWSAGESKTLYTMVKEGVAGGKIWSGDSLNNYGGWTMEAVALPATIGDGS